jgi:hypothetical protein
MRKIARVALPCISSLTSPQHLIEHKNPGPSEIDLGMSLAAGPGRGGGSSTSQDVSSLPSELRLHVDQHVKYIQALDTRKDEYAYWLTEHLRLNGVYWGLTALHLLGHPDALPRYVGYGS